MMEVVYHIFREIILIAYALPVMCSERTAERNLITLPSPFRTILPTKSRQFLQQNLLVYCSAIGIERIPLLFCGPSSPKPAWLPPSKFGVCGLRLLLLLLVGGKEITKAFLGYNLRLLLFLVIYFPCQYSIPSMVMYFMAKVK